MVKRVAKGSKYILRMGNKYYGQVVVALGDAGGWSGNRVDVRVESSGTLIEGVNIAKLE